MMRSPMMRVVGSIVWLVTALGCIHLGLTTMGHDFVTKFGLSHFSHLLGILFGIAGVISLIMFFMGGCCSDDHDHNGPHR